jgi:type II secretory ATPase GspE/PulE/Tfp pilus assembly ATPase PilB-like protein
MGIEPYLVASSLIGVLAQRLVRTLCPHCKVRFTPTPAQMQEIGLSPDQAGVTTLYEAGRCDLCRDGYLGRTGVFELLGVDEEVRRQVIDKIASGDIKQRAVDKGMRTLLADGRLKVLEGRTTIEELVRVCQRDDI